MKLWMWVDLMLPNSTMLLFICYFFLLSIGDIVALYKDAAGLWWHGRYRVVIEAIANLILNFLFGYLWGINGTLVATILTLLFLGNGYGSYIVFKHYLGIGRLKFYLRDTLYYSVVFVIIAFLTFYAVNFVSNDGFAGLVLRLAICIILSNTLMLLFFHRHDYFKTSKSMLLNIKKSSFHIH